MHAGTRDCCSSGSQHDRDAIDAARFGLPDPKELEDDPVLAGCCAEDLHEFRRAEALRLALQGVDRSTIRLKMHEQVLPPPVPLDGDESSLGSSDDDPELDDLRQRRMAELQRQAAERQQQAQRGYGHLNDVVAASLMEQVEELEGPVVVHVALPGCEAGAELDEHLTALAHMHRGTYFARVATRRGDGLAAALRLEALPGLVCLRSGAVVGRAAVSQFGPPGGLVEEEVTAYLQRLRVLRGEQLASGRQGRDAGRGQEALDAGSDAEEDEVKAERLAV
ncbi:hypothetical protein GPECTOR_39g459 [Gonium pectorale]|uniref:Phosducin thioredoxin-like domain-containing protein n=1 Tax=Gonium pectorale TaxID=33097 RepID=A0A150GBM5_GONPE|nr:hypothetical protein GPECTOR_39g459 [Gonium pectorale]|eukprot:KXZ46965.1 hypothetical protein GPECTOR_39g459 [Gonium pectorale]